MDNNKDMSSIEKKVFIVVSGDYSDYRIEAIFDGEDLCDAFIERHKCGERHQGSRDELRKEIHSLNPCRKLLADGLTHFCVMVMSNGDVDTVDKDVTINETMTVCRIMRETHHVKSHVDVYCWARDEDHAIKIATEKRQEINATIGWEKDIDF